MSVYRGFINKKFVSNRRTLNDDIQIFLAKSQDYEIRKAIASRVDLCEEAFRILMDDPIIDVVISLRNSEHLTSSDIEKIQKYCAKTIPKTTKSSSTTRRSLYS